MALVKSILLIDGENLVFRYQAMVKSGKKPKQNVVHIPDVFVWSPDIGKLLAIDVFRAIYYTSTVGDKKKIEELKNQISKVILDTNKSSMDNYYGKTQLIPFVFKKEKKSNKSRLVDIFIAVDAMKYAQIQNMECLAFLSGDSDFLKVYQEVMDIGKKVYLGALSSGCAEELNYSVDYFYDLDKLFFEN